MIEYNFCSDGIESLQERKTAQAVSVDVNIKLQTMVNHRDSDIRVTVKMRSLYHVCLRIESPVGEVRQQILDAVRPFFCIQKN